MEAAAIAGREAGLHKDLSRAQLVMIGLGVAVFDAMIVWIIILLSHLSFRRRHKAADLPVRMRWFPFIQIVGSTLLCAVLVTMGLDRETWRISWIVGVPWLVLISVVYIVLKARGAHPALNFAPPAKESAPN